MAKKNIKIFVNDIETEITIKRIKFKQAKDLCIALASKVDEILKYFDDNSLFSNFENIFYENIDFIADNIILKFTNISSDQLDDMDTIDVVTLVKDLLLYNNIDINKIINFLQPNKALGKKATEMLEFGGKDVPLQN